MHENPGRPITEIDWNEYQIFIDNILDDLKSLIKEHNIKNITGIPKGGIIPAIHLSNITGLTYIDYYLIHATKTYGNILIVDDISDTGDTLKIAILTIATIMMQSTSEIFTCTICMRKDTKFIPDVCAYTIHDEWVKFPWE
jgi:hypoxanthine phosphoribosyltransferase